MTERPAYSFTPEECGNIPMVLSIACAEWRHDECTAWFRCDCQHHRREAMTDPGGLAAALKMEGQL